MNGELANRAVAIGCSASEVRNLCTMSASELKSMLTWMVQVRDIMSWPSVPTLSMYSRMMR